MDFYYYNTNNEKIKLDISAGTSWKNLNIENQQLNSIFARIDNGDGNVSQTELNLLQVILEKADNIIPKSANNKVLENEEMDEVISQIQNGKITLPKTGDDMQWQAHVIYDIPYGDYSEFKSNPENAKNKIETHMRKYFNQYPENQYDIEIVENEQFGRFDIYYYQKNNSITAVLPQTNTVVRQDGTMLELKDYYDNEISNDETVDYSKVHQSADFGKFTITDKNGKKHVISYHMSDMYGRDVLDCRRYAKKVTELLANMPQSAIDKLIENEIKDIEFRSEYDDSFSDIDEEDYYRKNNLIDKNGNVIDILDDMAIIISPSLVIQERTYKDLSFERKDGIKIDIKDTSQTSSEIKIVFKSGNKYKINVKGLDKVQYHQWQIPKIKRVLEDLPESVLNDLSKEIRDIRFVDEFEDESGFYVHGSNTMALKADYDEEAYTISFVHELGHALDEQNGTMFSKSAEFNSKFEKLKLAAQNFNIDDYALSSPQEFFASVYAYLNYNENCIANHIAEIEKKVANFKDSKSADERKLYEQFQELINDVQIYVGQVQNLPEDTRADDKIKIIVDSECKDIIEEAGEFGSAISKIFPAQSIELELMGILKSDDKTFETRMKFFEKYSKNEYNLLGGYHVDLPLEVQNFFTKIITRMRELRVRMQSDR